MKILEVKNLKVYFDALQSAVVKALDGVSFDMEKGEVFGIAGESGSGKTMMALAIIRLVPFPGRITEGEVLFEGADLLKISGPSMRGIRGAGISMVFQEPATSLDPVFTIGEQLVEAVLAHQSAQGRAKAKELALEYLNRVHIKNASKVFYDYPHQLSGGTKQRAMLAMALINRPRLIILDEPTTALDVTIQAQMLDLLEEIISRERLSILFISHDFGIIARMCRRVAVMRAGAIIESGDKENILRNPMHPYTISLLESVKALT